MQTHVKVKDCLQLFGITNYVYITQHDSAVSKNNVLAFTVLLLSEKSQTLSNNVTFLITSQMHCFSASNQTDHMNKIVIVIILRAHSKMACLPNEVL